jgi:ADP-ribosylglycohydrolase
LGRLFLSRPLSTEWGHDTDSYASLLGAFIGAKHGVTLFPDHLKTPVHERLMADFGADLSKEAEFLSR